MSLFNNWLMAVRLFMAECVSRACSAKWVKGLAVCIIICMLSAAFPHQVMAENVIAKGYVLIEASTGRVISGSNIDTRLPMASTTKIMTALITLEQENIYQEFLVDDNAIMVEGTSMGLVKGDTASLYALANGMLLSSGNDSANAAAVRISGSIDKFTELMNERAEKLGMKNTNFVTPSGLHDEKHYSTAYDMALLAREAIKNPLFTSICSRETSRVSFGNPPFMRTLNNHNRLLKEYDGCFGVKTGFTKKAGRCLVSAAERDGVRLICVTLGAANDWQVHKNLFDYGFAQINRIKVGEASAELAVTLPVAGGERGSVIARAASDTYAAIESSQLVNIKREIFTQKFCYAPIERGKVVGEIRYTLNGSVVASTPLIAVEDVNRQPVKNQKKTLWDSIEHLFN